MKFGRNFLQVNLHWLTQSDSWYDVTLSRWRSWRLSGSNIITSLSCAFFVFSFSVAAVGHLWGCRYSNEMGNSNSLFISLKTNQYMFDHTHFSSLSYYSFLGKISSLLIQLVCMLLLNTGKFDDVFGAPLSSNSVLIHRIILVLVSLVIILFWWN